MTGFVPQGHYDFGQGNLWSQRSAVDSMNTEKGRIICNMKENDGNRPLDYFSSPSSDSCASTYARSKSLIRVWYPSPCALNHPIMSSSMRNVICFLRGIGFNPRRATAFANCSGVISGDSDVSMSSSRMASSLFQSVWLLWSCCFFEVLLLLIARRFSDRYDTDYIADFSVNNNDNAAFEKTQRNKASLRVLKTTIFNSVRHAPENALAIFKVDPVLAEILLPFVFVPLESHSVVTFVVMSMRPQRHALRIARKTRLLEKRPNITFNEARSTCSSRREGCMVASCN